MRNHFLIALLLLSLISCDKNERMDKPVKTITHTNGLIVKVDHDIKVVETKAGYKFNFAGESSRSINELEITQQSLEPKALDTFKKKDINGTTYYFKLTNENIGSGGSEYTYMIWKKTKKGGVLLVHYIQQETLPEFDTAWDIIENIE